MPGESEFSERKHLLKILCSEYPNSVQLETVAGALAGRAGGAGARWLTRAQAKHMGTGARWLARAWTAYLSRGARWLARAPGLMQAGGVLMERSSDSDPPGG